MIALAFWCVIVALAFPAVLGLTFLVFLVDEALRGPTAKRRRQRRATDERLTTMTLYPTNAPSNGFSRPGRATQRSTTSHEHHR
jgi:hypothetical protein